MTATSKKLLHLFGFVIHSPMNHTVGSWRHPRNNASGFSFAEPELWQEIARTLERGKFDGIFFADQFDTFRGSARFLSRYAVTPGTSGLDPSRRIWTGSRLLRQVGGGRIHDPAHGARTRGVCRRHT